MYLNCSDKSTRNIFYDCIYRYIDMIMHLNNGYRKGRKEIILHRAAIF